MPKRATWNEWEFWVKKLYAQRFKGWPRAEMRKYYDEGFTPLSAYEQAAKRRLKGVQPCP